MAVVHFFDSSALVKRYMLEAGTDVVNGLVNNTETRMIVSSLTRAEVSSAFVRRLPAKEARALLDALDKDLATQFAIKPVDEATVSAASTLVRRHRIRGCDAVQLLAALRISQALADASDPGAAISLVFVCADHELNAAARAEGLAALNPADTQAPEG